MLKRFYDYTVRNNILKYEQFGFLKQRSTTLACFNLVKEISQALNDKAHVAAIFLDMTRAFDFVQHDILVNKLEKYGIRGPPLQLLNKYLFNRKQYTEISKVIYDRKITYKSTDKCNKFGVHQGRAIFIPIIHK